MVTDYQQSERKPYLYCFVRTSFTYCRMVYYKLSSSLLRKPFSGFWRMKQGACPEFFDRGKVQTVTERTKSVCSCGWGFFSPQQIISQPNLPLSLLAVLSQMLILNLRSCPCEPFLLLKTYKSGHCGVTRSIATPPVLVIISRRVPLTLSQFPVTLLDVDRKCES